MIKIIVSKITNDLIDKIVAMYIPDGNPENWLKKIEELRLPYEFQLGEELEFIINGKKLVGNYLSMYDENIIEINVTLDDTGYVTTKDAMVNKFFLIK